LKVFGFVRAPALRLSRCKRLLLWTGAVFVLLLSALVIYARFWLVPDLPNHLPRIEAAASEALGQPISIGSLEARMGFTLFVRLEDARALDAADHEKVAIRAESIEGSLSWWSLLFQQPRFASLTLNKPELTLLRAADGDWRIAGLNPSEKSGEAPLEWLLEQRHIRIIGARIDVRDDDAGAPDFSLTRVELDWQRAGVRYSFGLSLDAVDAEGGQVAALNAEGSLQGGAKMPVSEWRGEVELQWRADTLLPWRGWVAADENWYWGALFGMTGSEAKISLKREQKDWRAAADANLQGVRLQFDESLPELKLREAAGHLSLSTDAAGKWQFASQGLQLVEEDGQTSAPLDLAASWQEAGAPAGAKTSEQVSEGKPDDLPRRVDLTANRLDLAYLVRLAAYFPLADTARESLYRHNPEGVLERVRFAWDAGEPQLSYTLEAEFSNLGLDAAGAIPGASGLSGRVRANEQGGQLTLDSRNLSISLPTVFYDPAFPLVRLNADVDWQKKPDTVEVMIRRLDFSGPHIDGKVSGVYESRPGEAGVIDLSGSFTNGRATEVWRYIPRVVNAEVSSWLREALEAGTGDAELVLRGNLEQFPFRGATDGSVFKITVQARDVTLRYNPDWPEITGISGELEFGAGMLIRVAEGRIFSTRISDKTTVSIPDFANEDHLLVDGEASGDTSDFLRFIEQSPVAAAINHFTDGITGQGEGRLELKLDLPLERIESGKAEGRYHFFDNRISFMQGLPPAHSVGGSLAFTMEDVASDGIQGDFLGRPFKLTVQSQKDEVLIKAEGGLEAAALRREMKGNVGLPEALLDGISGSANLQMEIKARGRTTDFLVTSTLEGLALNLPDPFAKSAKDRLPLRVSKRDLTRQGRDEIIVSLGEREQRRLEALLIMRDNQVERGAVAAGVPLRMPRQGLHVLFRQKHLDIDFWHDFLEGAGDKAEGSSATAIFPDMISLEAEELRFLGRDFAEVNLRLFAEGEGVWRAMLASKEVVGDLNWNNNGEGRIIADLRRVRLEGGLLSGNGAEEKAELSDSLKKLPDMDIRIGDFSIGDKNFGKVSLLAENEGDVWRLQNIVVENPDGQLTGHGVWDAAANRSYLDFRLVAHNSGKLLGRMGYPDMLRGGSANLEGKLEWQGAPLQFDTATLSGDLAINTANGQFSRIDPGMGKLLGLLSLQSLTRRLTLDFRDIFSDGYAFDSLTAKLKINAGVISTDGDLRIASPAGTILMSGTADMTTETQNLALAIQPELGGITAAGAAFFVNPLVGAAALLAQNFLKNPLNKVFSIRYLVTGSWDEPIVERQTHLPSLDEANDAALPQEES